MGPLDALWHLANLFAVPVLMGALAAALAKGLWRHELAGVAYAPLAGWATAANAAVVVAGLVILGRDGRIATYAAMVLACAVTLWWRGFARKPSGR